MRMKADVRPDRDTTMIDGSRRELLVNLARGAVVTIATHSSHGEDNHLRHLKIFSSFLCRADDWCVQD
jgi:hypothetical protein